MFKSSIRIAIVLGLLVTQSSHAWQFGDCEQIFYVSASAISNKQHGTTKEDLVKSLPPRDSRKEAEPLMSMREIIEDVFGYEITDQYVYSVYKTEMCLRRAQGKAVPESFAMAYPKLEKCSKESEDNKASCAMIAAGSTPD